MYIYTYIYINIYIFQRQSTPPPGPDKLPNSLIQNKHLSEHFGTNSSAKSSQEDLLPKKTPLQEIRSLEKR